jgi:hypothetical protein
VRTQVTHTRSDRTRGPVVERIVAEEPVVAERQVVVPPTVVARPGGGMGFFLAVALGLMILGAILYFAILSNNRTVNQSSGSSDTIVVVKQPRAPIETIIEVDQQP